MLSVAVAGVPLSNAPVPFPVQLCTFHSGQHLYWCFPYQTLQVALPPQPHFSWQLSLVLSVVLEILPMLLFSDYVHFGFFCLHSDLLACRIPIRHFAVVVYDCALGHLCLYSEPCGWDYLETTSAQLLSLCWRLLFVAVHPQHIFSIGQKYLSFFPVESCGHGDVKLTLFYPITSAFFPFSKPSAAIPYFGSFGKRSFFFPLIFLIIQDFCQCLWPHCTYSLTNTSVSVSFVYSCIVKTAQNFVSWSVLLLL